MSYQSTYLNIDIQEYSVVFAMDWSFSTNSMLAYKFKDSKKIKQKEVPSEIKSLKNYFTQFKGKKLIVFEETTGAHWLYVELLKIFDRIVICDPYRNSLLKEGPKTDKIDAFKLLQLLINNSLKEIYHKDSEIYGLRRFMSGYRDLIKATVRLKNQIAALKRGEGIKRNAKSYTPSDKLGSFVYKQQQSLLERYEQQKSAYEAKMREMIRKYPIAKNLLDISGIGIVFALIIYSTIVDGSRFKNKYKLYGYSGLALYPRDSGKMIKGKRYSHYNPLMKWVYKSAAQAAIGGKNDIHDYYIYLLGKGHSESHARNEIARYICRVSLAMIKHGSKYQAYSWRGRFMN